MFNKTEYQRNYRKEKLKRISLDIPNEQYAIIKAHADSRHESVNGFIKRSVDTQIKLDNA
ncbi:hypothetical protein [Butyrivibrio sp. AD3002]|uniref:hypothetical protein n=1 Tax=Butyrivibrio sp. AD3002 TaxID=1280670 RepID=UPI0003B40928|nr:hypothetical protein [Butyrivibrio sp. AD3002]